MYTEKTRDSVRVSQSNVTHANTNTLTTRHNHIQLQRQTTSDNSQVTFSDNTDTLSLRKQ